MAVPTYRTNLFPDPGVVGTGGLSYAYIDPGTGGTHAITDPGTTGGTLGLAWKLATWSVATTAVSGGMQLGNGTDMPVTPGQPYTASVYVKANKIQRVALKLQWMDSGLANTTSVVGTAVVLAANTWTRISVTATPPALSVYAKLFPEAQVGTSGTNWAINDWFGATAVQMETGSTATAMFYGYSPSDAGNMKSYSWSGTPNRSASKENYYGVWVEPAGNAGMPAVRVYATGLPATNNLVRITRTVAADTWNVIGWRGRMVTLADASLDWFCPSGVVVTYTMYLNGLVLNSTTITVATTTGWICDPLFPDQAMAVNLTWTDSTVLTLGSASFKRASYDPRSSTGTVAGSRYDISRGGQRSAARNVPVSIWAHNNATSDQFRAMVQGGGFLLVKPLPGWSAPAALMYFDAPVEESSENRGRGGSDTNWTWAGNLVAPVTQNPVSGNVTYAAVAANIGVRTYGSVQSASGTRKYVELQASPLLLGF